MPETVFDRKPANVQAAAASWADARVGSFWLDGIDLRIDPDSSDNRAQTGENRNADLVVVGAGFTGLWTAIRSKERNPERSVVVVNMDDSVGQRASGQNGGFLEASLTHGRLNGETRFPNEIDILDDMGRANLDEIDATVQRYGWDCDFERPGTLLVATEPHQLEWCEGDEVLGADEVRRVVNSPTFLGGAIERSDSALVHPGRLVAEMYRTARELGVLFTVGRVTRIVTAGSSQRVLLADGRALAAHKVALATNVFPSILRRFRWHVVPVYDHVLMTEPLSAEQWAAIGWDGREGVSDMGNQFHYYRRTMDGRILWGGYDAAYTPGHDPDRTRFANNPEVFQLLAEHFFVTFPQLEGLKFSHRWSGAIDTCSRFSVFFGTARRGAVAYAAGYTGLGVAATRFAADTMLDMLDGASTERTRLSMVRSLPIPFPPEPFRYPLISVVKWSMKRADRNGGKRNLLLRTLDALGLGFDS